MAISEGASVAAAVVTDQKGKENYILGSASVRASESNGSKKFDGNKQGVTVAVPAASAGMGATAESLSPSPTNFAGAYHPEFMFCGDCSSSAPPPPSVFPLHTGSGDGDGSSHTSRTKQSAPHTAGGRSRESETSAGGEEGDVEMAIRGGGTKVDKEFTGNALDDIMTRLPPPSSISHRSTIHISNLSTPGQIMVINSILEPLAGVTKLVSNLSDQIVDVHHDPLIVEVNRLVTILGDLGYDATVRRDGALDLVESANPTGLCRSVLFVDGICCATEVPAVKSILRSQGDPVIRVAINITTKLVYVDHDPFRISASLLADALNRERFGAKVRRDGGRNLPQGVGAQIKNAKGPGIRLNATDELKRPEAAKIGGKDHSPPLSADDLGVRMSRFVESTLHLPSMTMLDEVQRLERMMRQNYSLDQVRAFYPHIPSRTVKLEHDPKLLEATTVIEALVTEGFQEAAIAVDGAVENMALPEFDADEDIERRHAGGMVDEDGDRSWLGGLHINVAISGICWLISILSVFSGWENLKYAGIASVIFGIPPVAAKAWRTARRRQLDANCMMVIAAFGALFLGEFDEAASVAFLFAVSEFMEARATAKARKALGAIVSLRPEHANLMNRSTGQITIIPASQVPVGSHVSVRTGDKIPADGIVEEGTSTVDESSLTGESRPILKRCADQVSGGTINVGQTRLVVRTTSTVDDSAVSRLIQLVEESQANRSPTEKLVDSFAKRYTPFVLSLAAFLCTIPWAWGSDIGRYWTLNGLIIVVIACPCALTISTPVTYAAGLAATAQRGIIVKGGARLEALGNVKKIVFDKVSTAAPNWSCRCLVTDFMLIVCASVSLFLILSVCSNKKTGTITEGRFSLVHLELVGNLRTRKQLMELILLMEAPSSHPLSATLVRAAKAEGVTAPHGMHLKDHSILKGEGVRASVDDKDVYVGNQRLFERLGLYNGLDDSHRISAETWSKSGGTVGFLGIKGEGIIGMFCVSDKVRNEAKVVIAALKSDNFQVYMLTGDSDGAAKAVGKQVGIPVECIHSHLMPEDKLHFIDSLRGMGGSAQSIMCGTKELVLMIGDGVNDAPALAVSDVGVAMGEGAALAMEMSDVTLMDSNLEKLTYSIKMGSRVITTIRENILVSLLAKFVVVVLTFLGKMSLLWAIASDVGIMLLVTLNGMKLLPGRTGASFAEEHLIKFGSRKRSGPEGKYEVLPFTSPGEDIDMPGIV